VQFCEALTLAAQAMPNGGGLMQPTVHYFDDDQSKRMVRSPAFSPHCLRHTCAMWTYIAEKRQGNSEPWKVVQARLGHAHLKTTTDTYLRATSEFEALVSDRMAAHIARIQCREDL